jgi:hypothetical protein
VEKYGLLILLLGKQSAISGQHQQELVRLKQQYALDNAVLVVVFLGKKANRVIAGQKINEIDSLPDFDDSEGTADSVHGIKTWIYEAQAISRAGSTCKVRTAIFADVSEDIVTAFGIDPADLSGDAEDVDYFKKIESDETGDYEPVVVSHATKLEALAITGDEKALYKLGLLYVTGEGVEKNPTKAQMLLYKAYLRGHIDAIYALVDLFDEPGKHFCEEAARHGHLKAAAMLNER